jgi:DNA invertase Pin-like site-specific DNA recombinase
MLSILPIIIILIGLIKSQPLRAVIYTRISNGSQTTEQQVLSCQKYCESQGWNVIAIVEEVRSTRKSRPKKEELLKSLRRREYDVLVVFRLDRWTRSLSELVQELEDLDGRGVRVVSLHEAIDLSSALGRAMVQLIGVFAQLERDLISEATRERLQALKAVGKCLGHSSSLRGEKYTQLVALKAEGKSNRQAAEELGVSEAAVRRALRDGVRRCPTPINSKIISSEATSPSLTTSPSQSNSEKTNEESE